MFLNIHEGLDSCGNGFNEFRRDLTPPVFVAQKMIYGSVGGCADPGVIIPINEITQCASTLVKWVRILHECRVGWKLGKGLHLMRLLSAEMLIIECFEQLKRFKALKLVVFVFFV